MAITLSAVAACTPPKPDRSYDLAAQGIYTGALSSGAEYAIVGSLNHGASLWRNSDHERLYNWTHQSGEYAVLVAAGFSPDGSRAVTTDPRTLVLWDTFSGAAIAYWTTPAPVLDVALVPGGQRVLMGLEDHSAVLFDAEQGDHLFTLLHDGVVGSVDVSANGLLALTGSDDETAVLWNLADGQPVHRFAHDNPVRIVALSSTGQVAFTAAQGKRLVIWDGESGAARHTLDERNRGVTSARFSADERHLLVGYVNRRIELWDVATGRLLQVWNAGARNPWHPTGAAILAVGFTSQQDLFYALAGDGRLVELRGS